MSKRIFKMIDNYIYLYHTDTIIALPLYAESVTDSMGANYNSTSPLSRSAPIPSYASSGPRQVSLTFDLHRDMMQQINYGVSNLDTTIDDDYVDYLVKSLQACAVPQYNATQKMVDPPLVAVRLGNDIFIKGIVNGTVNVTYKLPVLENGKYACISVTFNVQEVDPYSADQIQSQGSYRGISKTLERRVYTSGR